MRNVIKLNARQLNQLVTSIIKEERTRRQNVSSNRRMTTSETTIRRIVREELESMSSGAGAAPEKSGSGTNDVYERMKASLADIRDLQSTLTDDEMSAVFAKMLKFAAEGGEISDEEMDQAFDRIQKQEARRRRARNLSEQRRRRSIGKH